MNEQDVGALPGWASSELELLLQAYSGQGEYESTGSFTVDPEKLREKLSRYLLPEPHAYILKLVQWAVAAGASRIKVEVGRRDVLFAHDGRTTDEAAAADWGYFLESRWQQDEMRTAEVELACALNALHHLNPGRTVLLQRNQSEAVILEMTPEGSRRTEAPNSIGKPVNLLKIERRRPAFGSPLASQQFRYGSLAPVAQARKLFQRNISLAEIALLQACCSYCPILIQVNGKCINRPVCDLAGQGDLVSKMFQRKRPFSLRMDGTRNLNNHVFAYHLGNSNLELAGPSYHPGAALSSWYCSHSDDSVVESRSNNRFAVRGLLNWTLNSRMTIETAPTVNVIASTVYRPLMRPGKALVSGVVRGVRIETDTDGLLPQDTYTVLSNYSLGTDLSGLRIRKSHERTQFLRDWSDKLKTIFERRRKG